MRLTESIDILPTRKKSITAYIVSFDSNILALKCHFRQFKNAYFTQKLVSLPKAYIHAVSPIVRFDLPMYMQSKTCDCLL